MNQPLTGNACVWNGCYGSLHDTGEIFFTEFHCGPKVVDHRQKEVILVVDVSASMETSLTSVKASILAFRDALSDETIALRLITFSDTAEEIWFGSTNDASHQTGSLDQAIQKLCLHHKTNMGAGIELAYQRVRPTIATWIIVMTDGVSNCGRYQTVEAFTRLAMRRPPLVTMITFGYGNGFDVETLTSVGTFTHIQNQEMIAPVFGALSHEIRTAWAVNCVIETPADGIGISPPKCDVIVVEAQPHVERVVIGSRTVGTLFDQRHYTFALVGTDLQEWVGHEIYLLYHDISTGKTEKRSFVISQPDHEDATLPLRIRKAFFVAAKGRLLEQIYSHIKQGLAPRHLEKFIKERVIGWDDPIAEEHREELIRLARDYGQLDQDQFSPSRWYLNGPPGPRLSSSPSQTTIGLRPAEQSSVTTPKSSQRTELLATTSSRVSDCLRQASYISPSFLTAGQSSASRVTISSARQYQDVRPVTANVTAPSSATIAFFDGFTGDDQSDLMFRLMNRH